MRHFILMFALFTLCVPVFAQKIHFKWVEWENVSETIKADIKTYKSNGEILYTSIQENLDMGCSIRIAVIDLDGDGKSGYAICASGTYCCGAHGCSFEAYEDKGKKKILLTDECDDVQPAKNGVITSMGKRMLYK